MSRFTASVLMATALLGVLLWVVLSMARDFARGPAEPEPDTAATVYFDPALARINNARELRNWLQSQGQPVESLNAYREWLQARGYPLSNPLLDNRENRGLADYAELDEASLLLLAGRGDISALQLLAERSLADDPLAALEWYDQAVVNGSLYAMLRMSDLLLTLADPALQNFASREAWLDSLKLITEASPGPQERALAWALALLTAGGYGVLNEQLADRITELAARLDSAALERACTTAQDYVLSTAALRRAQGDAVFSLERPPLALSVAEPEQLNPCAVKLPPLLTMEGCSTADFVGPGPRQMTAWFCT